MWTEEKEVFDSMGNISDFGLLGFAAEFAWCENSKKLEKKGDVNVHVGQDRKGFERDHGERGFEIRDQDGERIVDMAEAHDLAIASTFIMKRESQKVAYCSGGRKSEIDHILVKRDAFKTIEDVKSIPGEEVAWQHRPVVAEETGKD
ncbi:hypothetical protein Y032_0090g2367 [Ancylostoma ceylanicum]|uniref:Uncharacterized protein n=1 Tax=Ancylostoma ceylanicum TaxID=53326 RepID=A0A016TMY4_9BILA|nr:hypothetical protein Y032_0090g2367 [Ancylostoma ceylanicum]